MRYLPFFPLRFLFGPAILFFPCLMAAATPAVPQCEPGATSEFLNTRLAFWQQRLNLGDWKLSVVSSRPADLKPETLGNIHWDADKKTATVRVLSPADYRMACPAALDDMELTVVHELVHLTLSHLRSSNTNRDDEEHAVVQISEALLKLDRAGRPRIAAPSAIATNTAASCPAASKTEACRTDHR